MSVPPADHFARVETGDAPLGFQRVVGRWQILGLAINDVVGSGIYLLPAATALLLGPASLWAVVLAGLAVCLLVLTYAQAASYFDEPGGSYLYAREAFGPFVGFEVGWMIWLTRVTSAAALSNGLASAVAHVRQGVADRELRLQTHVLGAHESADAAPRIPEDGSRQLPFAGRKAAHELLRHSGRQFVDELRTVVTDRSIKTPFRTGWQADYPSMLNYLGPIYATGAGSNDGDYSNKEFDNLLKQAAAAQDDTERYKLLADAQAILFKELPAIPLWNQSIAAAAAKGVDNVEFNWQNKPELQNVTK
jgi:hypothetical protein